MKIVLFIVIIFLNAGPGKCLIGSSLACMYCPVVVDGFIVWEMLIVA